MPTLHHRLHSLHTGGSVSARVTGRALPFLHEASSRLVFPDPTFWRQSPVLQDLTSLGHLSRASQGRTATPPPTSESQPRLSLRALCPSHWVRAAGLPRAPRAAAGSSGPRLAPPPLPDARAASGSVASAHRRACAAIGSAGCPSPPLRPGGRFSRRSRSPGGSGAARSADRGGHGPARGTPWQQPSHGGRELGDALLRPGLGHVAAGGAPRSTGASARSRLSRAAGASPGGAKRPATHRAALWDREEHGGESFRGA